MKETRIVAELHEVKVWQFKINLKPPWSNPPPEKAEGGFYFMIQFNTKKAKYKESLPTVAAGRKFLIHTTEKQQNVFCVIQFFAVFVF